MLVVVGFIIVIVCVFGGYVVGGGVLGPIYQPAEITIIIGAAIGSFVASNNMKAIKATFRTARRLKRTKRYNRALYMDLMAMEYQLLTKLRREGQLGIEKDVENPAESELFKAHPRVSTDPLIMQYLTDYLRLMASGHVNPIELDELMTHEIETLERDLHVPVDALFRTGDALPAFGIVAAVLGVVKALASAGSGASVMGAMIAHALVGTFAGIFLAYGLVNPMASALDRQIQEAIRMLQCIRVTLLATMNGYVPQLAVEFGRKALSATDRPTFEELEEHIRNARHVGAPRGDGADGDVELGGHPAGGTP